jgi:signal transduction histidine kinase
MKLRAQMTTVVFISGLLGTAALVMERTHASREMFYGRAEARAQALGEIVADLVSPSLADGDAASVGRKLAAVAEFPSVVSVSVLDPDGEVVARSGGAPEADTARDELAASVPIANRATREPLGRVRVVLSTRSLEEALGRLFWKTLAFGAVGLLVLAGAAWTVGFLLGRRLETLVDVLERADSDQPPVLAEGGTADELDRLARGFNALRGRLLHEKAERLQLEAFRNDLTNMLVHDMKHPITVMGVVLALLQEEDGELDADKRTRLFGIAKRNIRRESVMIENLMQMAKLKNAQLPLRKTRLNLREFMAGCAEENAFVVEQDGRPWRLEAGEELDACWIFGDLVLLKRVVGNLVFNAIDHSPAAGGITLGARLRGKGAPVVEIFVRDEGAGIPAERREAIFLKYQTSGESAKNAGLGLAFCKLVAERHAARLELVDSGQPGTTFALVIAASTRPMIADDADLTAAGAGRTSES